MTIIIALIVLVVGFTFVTADAAKKKALPKKWIPKKAHVSMSYKQEAENNKNIVFKFNNYKDLVKSKKVNKLKIDLKMKIKGKAVKSKSFTMPFKKTGKKFILKAPDYGRWYVTTSFYRSNKTEIYYRWKFIL